MESTEKNAFLEWALFYAENGLYVFPAKPGQKTPAISNWQNEATTDAEKIKKWWAQNPSYNVAIATGSKSRLFVVDSDAANGKKGVHERNKYAILHGFPQTWTASTPRGGLHDYYRTDTTPGNAVGLHGGVDVRGEGGLIIAPPSTFEGKTYTWTESPAGRPIAEPNSAVMEFIAQPQESPVKRHYSALEPIAEGGRTNALISLCGMLKAKGLSDDAIRAAVQEENENRCTPPLSDAELEKQVFPCLNREKWSENVHPYTKDRVIDTKLLQIVLDLNPAESPRYGLTDAGAALLFMDATKDSVLYDQSRKAWVFYDGKRWDINGENRVKEKLKSLASVLCVYAQNLQDDEKRKVYTTFYARWHGHSFRKTILEDAASVRPVSTTDFDKDKFLINLQNGTYDLKRHEFREHSPADMLTKLAGAKYDANARAPRWLQFMDEVTGGDAALSAYIQKALGYSLTGDTSQHCFFILYGATTRNGKSTLVESYMHVLGDYAATINPETLAINLNKKGNDANEDVARLIGARFVTASELPHGMELSSNFMKRITGDDKITARYLYQNSFEFYADFKIFINTNHLPHVNDVTVFSSDRIKVLPFKVHFDKAKQDKKLREKLTSEESTTGLLNWCIDGLKAFQQEGLEEPQAVLDSVDEYRLNEDKLARFLEEKTEESPAEFVPITALYACYQAWCFESGHTPASVKNFRHQLEERQIPIKRKRPQGAGAGANPITAVFGLKMA